MEISLDMRWIITLSLMVITGMLLAGSLFSFQKFDRDDCTRDKNGNSKATIGTFIGAIALMVVAALSLIFTAIAGYHVCAPYFQVN